MAATLEQMIADTRRWLPALVAARDALVRQHREIEAVLDAALHPTVFMPPANRALLGLEQAIEALTAVIARAEEALDDADEDEPSLA